MFNDDHNKIIPFQNHTDLKISEIIPLILYQLIIQPEIDTVSNYSITNHQITSTEYKYTVDITTDSNSHMVRFRTYIASQFHSEYTEHYQNISLLAIMLQSSIDFTSSTHDRLMFFAQNDTTSNTEDATGLIDDNGVDYEILNEWYFILVLLVIIIGFIICASVLIKNYYSGCTYYASFGAVDSESDNECSIGGSIGGRASIVDDGYGGFVGNGFKRGNIDLSRMSIAGSSIGSESHTGYDRSVGMDERDRLSNLNSIASHSGDDDSLLNSNYDDSDHGNDNVYLSYDPKYDSTGQ